MPVSTLMPVMMVERSTAAASKVLRLQAQIAKFDDGTQGCRQSFVFVNAFVPPGMRLKSLACAIPFL